MSTRVVTGPIYRPNTNVPWANTVIIFKLESVFIEDDITYPTESKRYAVNSAGNFSASLAVPASGTATYRIILPDDTNYITYIPAGNAIVLSNLIAAAIPQQPQNTTIELIESYLGGTGSIDRYYRHVQSSASTSWVIAHNLNKYPSITVVDSSGDQVIGDVTYDSVNQATVTFSAAFSGEAYAN